MRPALLALAGLLAAVPVSPSSEEVPVSPTTAATEQAPAVASRPVTIVPFDKEVPFGMVRAQAEV